MLTLAAPILPSRDLDATEAFYGSIGFRTALRQGNYPILQRDALGLPHADGYPRSAPAEDKPWGMREAALWDPDGNLLRIGQDA